MDISIKDAKDRLTELARRVESGETVTVTRHGKAVMDLVPHKPKVGRINWEALAAYKASNGIERIVQSIASDFDAPLPEDFLISALPEE